MDGIFELEEPVLQHLQASAFRQLCLHLQERSDVVSNIDMMTVSGFCRNCLAKVCYLMSYNMNEICIDPIPCS
jgi:hypothetical protein